jgi:8-oxo-dGTP diphosphatase
MIEFTKPQGPETTVGAILLRQNANHPEVLLTRRGFPPYKEYWCMPGGHIDPNETSRQAIVREVKEEVGLDFSPRFFTYFDEIIPDLGIHAVVLVFEGFFDGEVTAQPGEVLETGWFSFQQALELPLAFQHHQILAHYIQSRAR